MSRAEDKRVWLAGGAALALVIVAIGWLAVISPQLSSANSLRDQADSARAQNAVLAAKVAKLKRQNDKVGQLKTSLRTALAGLPFDSGLPTYTRQVAAQATRNKVALTSISVGASTATTTAAAAPTTATPTASTATSGTTTPGATTPTTTAAATVMAIPITLLSKGSNAHQLAFLKAIQVIGPRRALVLSTTIGSGSTAGGPSIDKSATMTTQLTIFSAPLDPAGRAQLAKLLSAK